MPGESSSGRLRGLGRGLAATEPPADTILIYATAPNENALDSVGASSSNGLFAKHLLARIEEPGLTVDQLFGMVAESVSKEAAQSNVRQLPYRNSALSTVFCLGSCEAPPSAESVEQINRLNAQLDDLKIKFAQREEEIALLAEVRAKYAQREAEILALQRRNAERDASIGTLTSRIQELQRNSANLGATKDDVAAELTRLRRELGTIQQERERDAARLEQQNVGRERELTELRAREAESQRLAQEVERYRRQVQELQKEKEELQRRPARMAEVPPPPRVIVPSF